MMKNTITKALALAAALCGFALAAQADVAYIDVMFALDKKAVTYLNDEKEGTTPAQYMSARLAEMNQVLVNSGLDDKFQFRSAGVYELGFEAKQVDSSKELTRDVLENATGGKGMWEDLHTERDNRGADVVSVIIDTGSEYGHVGDGNALTSIADASMFGKNAYSVVGVRSTFDYYAILHEIAHNMGAGHASEVGAGSHVTDYAYGYYFAGNTKSYYTIMGYPKTGYSPAPIFSTPDETYDGVAAGTSTKDNVRVLEQTFLAASQWRSLPAKAHPAMSVAWNQSSPMNDFAAVAQKDGSWQKAPCGCPATAAAQMLKHYVWPMRTDSSFTGATQRYIDNTAEAFPIRFDGHNDFQWAKMQDHASDNDVVGNFETARLTMWCGAMGGTDYRVGDSSAQFDDIAESASELFQKGKSTYFFSDGAEAVWKAITNALDRGELVQVTLKGHQVVADDYRLTSGDLEVHLNYGWAGSQTGWYTRTQLSDEYSGILYVWTGFAPKKMAQLKPVARQVTSTGTIPLSWALPQMYANDLTGFMIMAYYPGDSVVNSYAGDTGTIAADRAGTYTLTGVYKLTNESSLSCTLSSYHTSGIKAELQARYDAGEWTTIATPELSTEEDEYDKGVLVKSGWLATPIAVDLSSHAGETAEFRFKISRTAKTRTKDGQIFFSKPTWAKVYQPVSQQLGLQGYPTLRSYPLSASFYAGKVVSFTIEPIMSDSVVSEPVATKVVTTAVPDQPAVVSIDALSSSMTNGFQRTCGIGKSVFFVKANATTTAVTAAPSHLALVPDSKVSCTSVGDHTWAVTIDAEDTPANSQMILTLIAQDALGNKSYKDLQLTFRSGEGGAEPENTLAEKIAAGNFLYVPTEASETLPLDDTRFVAGKGTVVFDGGMPTTGVERGFGTGYQDSWKGLVKFINFTPTQEEITRINYEFKNENSEVQIGGDPEPVPTPENSFGFDGNQNASTILGGTAPTVKDEWAASPTYTKVRGSDSNYAATINSASGTSRMAPYGQLTAMKAQSWSVHASMKLADVNTGILFGISADAVWRTTGVANYIALEYVGNNQVRVVKGKGKTFSKDELIAPTTIANATTAYHSYLLTYTHGDSPYCTLYVDGVKIADSAAMTTVTDYQWWCVGGIYGGPDSISSAIMNGAQVDDFAIWTTTALAAAQAQTLASKFPTWPTIESHAATASGTCNWTGLSWNPAWPSGGSADAIANITVGSGGAALTINANETMSKMNVTSTAGNDLTLAIGSGVTATVAAYDFSNAAGKATVNYATGTTPVTAGADTVLTSVNNPTLTIASGKKLTVKNGTVQETTTSNGGTLGFDGGTSSSPIVYNANGGNNGNLGTWSLAQDAYVKVTPNNNKTFNINGAGAASSTVEIYKTSGQGLSTGSQFRNLKLIANITGSNQLWLEQANCVDATVALVAQGQVKLNNNDSTVGSLSGSGTIYGHQSGRVLTIAPATDATYSGDVGDNNVTITIASGSATQTLSGYTKALTVNAGGKVALSGSANPSSITSSGLVTVPAGQLNHDVTLNSGATINITTNTPGEASYAITSGTFDNKGTVQLNGVTLPTEEYKVDGNMIVKKGAPVPTGDIHATVASGATTDWGSVQWYDSSSQLIGTVTDFSKVTSAALAVNGTLTFNSTTGVDVLGAKLTMSGSGTIIQDGASTATALPTAFTGLNQNAWTGTIWYKNYGTNANTGDLGTLANRGNAGSTVKFTNIKGYIEDTTSTIPYTLELEDGANATDYAWDNANGWSGRNITIAKLTGSGTFAESVNNNSRQFFKFTTVENFTGRVWLKGTKKIGLGCSPTDSNGTITIGEGVEVAASAAKPWQAGATDGSVTTQTATLYVNGKLTATDISNIGGTGTITVGATGTIEFTKSCASGDAGSDYSRVTGTGKFKVSGSGYYTLPNTSEKRPATTLQFVNEKDGGVIVTEAGSAAETVLTSEIGTLSGSKNFRMDWVPAYVNNRSLKILQAHNSTWTGKFGNNQDRLKEFIVAGATGATEKTLTLSATFDGTNPTLNVESTGSVNLTGTWAGAATIAGEIMGAGTISGAVTFGAGAMVNASSGVLTANGTLTFGATTKVRVATAPAGDVKIISKSGTTAGEISTTVSVYVGSSETPETGNYKLAYKTDGVYLVAGESPYAKFDYDTVYSWATTGSSAVDLAGASDFYEFDIVGCTNKTTLYHGSDTTTGTAKFWHRFAHATDINDKRGAIIRLQQGSYCTTIGGTYGAMSFGGIIAEAGDTGYTISQDSGTRATILGDPNAATNTFFDIGANITFNRNGNLALSGTLTIDIASGKAFNLNASQTSKTLELVSTVAKGVNGNYGTTTPGGNLIMKGAGTLSVNNLKALGSTLDYRNLPYNRANAYISGTLTINDSTVIKLPADLPENTPFKMATTLSGATSGDRTIWLGDEQVTKNVTFANGTISYSTTLVYKYLGWNGSAWTNGVGEVTAVDSTCILNAKDGDVITFSSNVTPHQFIVPQTGTVTINDQQNLSVSTVEIPSAATLVIKANNTFSPALTGSGTLSVNPGQVQFSGPTKLPALSGFSGKLQMVSGRLQDYTSTSLLPTAVTLEILDGAQLFVGSALTLSNTCIFRGNGWTGESNIWRYGPARFGADVTLSGSVTFDRDNAAPQILIASGKTLTLSGAVSAPHGFTTAGSDGTIKLTTVADDTIAGAVTLNTGDIWYGTGKDSGGTAGTSYKCGDTIIVKTGRTFNLHPWTTTQKDDSESNKVILASAIDMLGGTFHVEDGSYVFSGDFNVSSNSTLSFKWAKGRVIKSLTGGSDVTLTVNSANPDTSVSKNYFKGGDFAGTLKLTGSGTGAYCVPYDTALSKTTVSLESGWDICLTQNATIGSLNGGQSVFGDGTASPTLTLKGGIYSGTLKDTSSGAAVGTPLSLSIDGEVALSGGTTYSGATTVNPNGVLALTATAQQTLSSLVFGESSTLIVNTNATQAAVAVSSAVNFANATLKLGNTLPAAGGTIKLLSATGGITNPPKTLDSRGEWTLTVTDNTLTATKAKANYVKPGAGGNVSDVVNDADSLDISRDLAKKATKDMEKKVTDGSTTEQVVEALNQTGKNTYKVWESAVLGLDPNDATSQLVISPTPVQGSDPTKIILKVPTVNVDTTTGADVTFCFWSKTGDGDWTEVQGGVVESDEEKALALPSEGVMYYQLRTTIKAGQVTPVPTVIPSANIVASGAPILTTPGAQYAASMGTTTLDVMSSSLTVALAGAGVYEGQEYHLEVTEPANADENHFAIVAKATANKTVSFVFGKNVPAGTTCTLTLLSASGAPNGNVKVASSGFTGPTYADVMVMARLADLPMNDGFGGQSGHNGYRIPALATDGAGEVIACYDVRQFGSADWSDLGVPAGAGIDIGESYSDSRGVNFDKPRLGIDVENYYHADGTKESTWTKDKDIGDVSIVWDPSRSQYWLMGITGKGLTNCDGTNLNDVVLYTRAKGRGTAWTEWHNPDLAGETEKLKYRSIQHTVLKQTGLASCGRGFLEGPGHGMVTKIGSKDGTTIPIGTVVFPVQYFLSSDTSNIHAGAIYLKPGEITTANNWVATGRTPGSSGPQENCVMELDDGSWYMMCKYSTNYKAWRTTNYQDWVDVNDGLTGVAHVQGSCLRIGVDANNVGQYVFCHANDTSRQKLTLFFGVDTTKGETGTIPSTTNKGIQWDLQNGIMIDIGPCGGMTYNSMCMLDDHTLGILYETQWHIQFVRIDVSDKVVSPAK